MVTIRFQDCDPLSHLNNSRYLDYFLNTREDQILDAYGIDLHKLAVEDHKNWLVKQHKIDYLKPATLRERVNILSRIIDYDETENWVEMIMTNEKQNQVKCVLWTQFIYVDLKTNRRSIHPEPFMKLFEEVTYTREKIDVLFFEDRVSAILKNKQSYSSSS